MKDEHGNEWIVNPAWVKAGPEANMPLMFHPDCFRRLADDYRIKPKPDFRIDPAPLRFEFVNGIWLPVAEFIGPIQPNPAWQTVHHRYTTNTMSNLNQYYAGIGENPELFEFGPITTPEMARTMAVHRWEKDNGEAIPPGFTVSVGRLEIHIPNIDAQDIIDQLSCRATDQCGEVADDWLANVTPNHRDKLTAGVEMLVMGWLHEIGEIPEFGSIEDVEVWVWKDTEKSGARWELQKPVDVHTKADITPGNVPHEQEGGK